MIPAALTVRLLACCGLIGKSASYARLLRRNVGSLCGSMALTWWPDGLHPFHQPANRRPSEGFFVFRAVALKLLTATVGRRWYRDPLILSAKLDQSVWTVNVFYGSTSGCDS